MEKVSTVAPNAEPAKVEQETKTNQIAVASRETQAYITPFAFSINESLLGTKIAAPWRRALAIIIDTVIISIIATASAL